LLCSSGFVFLKLGLQHADPLTFLVLRETLVPLAVAGMFLAGAGVYLVTFKSGREKPLPR
jgi:drug/metabolite transporter (DMT)-like permease